MEITVLVRGPTEKVIVIIALSEIGIDQNRIYQHIYIVDGYQHMKSFLE